MEGTDRTLVRLRTRRSSAVARQSGPFLNDIAIPPPIYSPSPRDKRLPLAPTSFDGTLDDLYEQVIQHTLPTVEAVVAFHQTLVDYLAEPGPLFLIRYMRDTKHSVIYTVADGSHFQGDGQRSGMVDTGCRVWRKLRSHAAPRQMSSRRSRPTCSK